MALVATGGIVWSHLLDESAGADNSIRPPGARPEPDFLASCIKCGQCVEACPFDTLRLATSSDHEAIGTPYFKPREVPCYMCEDIPCANVCPTDALQKLSLIEDADMGLAVLIDQENCLAFRGLRCEVCYRTCPLIGKAITLDYRPQKRTGKHAFFLPVVNSDACTGCGKCENSCVIEEPAIKVLPRDLAKGRMGSNYQFGWLEEPIVTQDFEAPLAPPEIPQFENNMKRVLEEMEDLSGIQEP